MTRQTKLAAGAVLYAFIAIALVGGVRATPPDQNGEHKVTICHRTASDTNPYVFIEVDVASLDAHLNNLPGHPAKTNEDGSPRNDYLATTESECVTSSPTTSPTSSPAPSVTPEPTATPEPTVTPTPTPQPTEQPTPQPTDPPERPDPTPVPTVVPTVPPTPAPTAVPEPEITLPPTDTE